MIGTLIRKLLRDLRLYLIVICILLCAFQCLWVKITQRIVGELVPYISTIMLAVKLAPEKFEEKIFSGPGKLMQTLMGGERIQLDRAMDMMTIGYVHPLMQALFCIWAIGRGAGAIAGEIDRGTMELLLAQPIPRYRVILAHLCVDGLTIPALCLSLWAGTFLGNYLVGPITIDPESLKEIPVPAILGPVPPPNPETLEVWPRKFGPGLINTAALIFAVSGCTMWLSARGRFRGRVMGAAVLITLVQFLINVVGQLWDVMAPFRQLTVFYYYQPQQIILENNWMVPIGQGWNGSQPLLMVNVLVVLCTVGIIGYAGALWSFCQRDLPAPL